MAGTHVASWECCSAEAACLLSCHQESDIPETACQQQRLTPEADMCLRAICAATSLDVAVQEPAQATVLAQCWALWCMTEQACGRHCWCQQRSICWHCSLLSLLSLSGHAATSSNTRPSRRKPQLAAHGKRPLTSVLGRNALAVHPPAAMCVMTANHRQAAAGLLQGWTRQQTAIAEEHPLDSL